MSFDLDKFVKRPSFYFLASQAILFLSFLIAANLVAFGYHLIKNNSIYETQFLFLFGVLCTFPMLVLYSFIAYLGCAIFRKMQNLFTKGYLLIHFIIFLLISFFVENPVILEGNGVGLGFVIVLGLCISLTIIFIGVFSFIPYFILFVTDKKRMFINEIPYCQNKFYLSIVLLSVGFYIFTALICIYNKFNDFSIIKNLFSLTASITY